MTIDTRSPGPALFHRIGGFVRISRIVVEKSKRCTPLDVSP